MEDFESERVYRTKQSNEPEVQEGACAGGRQPIRGFNPNQP